jgi:hypothetical protein
MQRAPAKPYVVEINTLEDTTLWSVSPHAGLKSGRKLMTIGKASCMRTRKMASFGISPSLRMMF